MVRETVYNRLLDRELGSRSRYSNVRGIYGDKKWVRDLDIVNELEAHRGCVNALSWSKSGRLLASGSDDRDLNIHTYQPDSSIAPFNFATSISTGHTANIFSVKFMPHTNDSVLVTAAGDAEVRVFDVEHSSRSLPGQSFSQSASGYQHTGLRHLSEGDTGAKVYRSHSDRVKRIVTESSPYFFLTCSEDGEVRQWDLRQPSSAYPRGEPFTNSWATSSSDAPGDAPPPLISYKRWRIDLNTISCSPSQPYYIALGGSHLHCFLHDRRMLGRDRALERGQSAQSSPLSEHEDEAMGEATQCVKRFAPYGRRTMKASDNGHITACKISDANPNEVIASWSGDWIYSFDIVHSRDAREPTSRTGTAASTAKSKRARESADRKRKRAKDGSTLSLEGSKRAGSKARRAPPVAESSQNEQVSLRVRYENGQSENIPLGQTQQEEETRETLSEAEKESHRIASTSVKIRKSMFTLPEPRQVSGTEPTGYTRAFTSVLGFAASILDDMDEIMRAWRYPVDPDEIDVVFQKTLMRNRQSARRFVQAAGTLARLLGGKLHTAGSNPSAALDSFIKIVPAPNEKEIVDDSERFSYDFLKAILLWLDSGVGALVEGFAQRGRHGNRARFPLSQNPAVEDLDETLIPYLLQIASDRPIPDVDASPFLVDEERRVFATEKAAVAAFAQAVKIPFGDLSGAVDSVAENAEGGKVTDRIRAQDRRIALKFWGLKVARGLLLNAGEGVNHVFVDRAFGGLGRETPGITEEEQALRRRLENVDSDESVPLIERITEVRGSESRDSTEEQEDEDDGEVIVHLDDVREAMAASNEARNASLQDNDVEDVDEDEDDNSSDTGESSESEDEDETAQQGSAQHFLSRAAASRAALRRKVQSHVPCMPHERFYTGHCNVKTVKDVNYYGLNDEYIVSGSDSGHVFIWDRATSKLLNILEGDGEVVNVVQGHPYEPMLAVSGIDSTVKIFSPDSRARSAARKGVGVSAVDSSTFSSIRFLRSRRGRQSSSSEQAAAKTSEPAVPAASATEDDEDSDNEPVAANGLSSRKRMHQEYEITAQNDVERRGQARSTPFLTRGMLAQLIMHMQRQHPPGGGGANAGATQGDEEGGGGDNEGEDDDDDDDEMPVGLVTGDGSGSVVLSDDCDVM